MTTRTVLAFTVAVLISGPDSRAGEDPVKGGDQVRLTAGHTMEIPGVMKIIGAGPFTVETEGAVVAADSRLVAVTLPGATQPVALPRPGSRLVGRLVSMDDRTLTIRFDGHDQPFSVPRDVIGLLEVNRGKGRRPFMTYVVVGVVAGAVPGMVIGYASDNIYLTSGQGALVGAATLGVLGGLGGAIVASAKPGRHWEPVKLGAGPVRVGLETQTRGGVGLRMSVSF